MADRYFSAEPIIAATAKLGGSEAHHLLHVMRAKAGDELIVFDGTGGEFEAEIAACGRSEIELAVGPRSDVERELPFRLTLAVPFPKGDRQRWLVEKAVELGVAELVPLKTARSVGAEEASAKLSRYVIEASKQCGRNRLMQFAKAATWQELLNRHAERRLFAHPEGGAIDCTSSVDTLLAIGPEGGFTDDEVAAAVDAGWQQVGLGKRILRMETAAVALVSKIAMP